MVHMTAMGGDPTAAGAGCPPGPEGWRKGMADFQENVACQNDTVSQPREIRSPIRPSSDFSPKGQETPGGQGIWP